MKLRCQMLETLRQVPFFVSRHREAPLLKEREMFLRHLEPRNQSQCAPVSIE